MYKLTIAFLISFVLLAGCNKNDSSGSSMVMGEGSSESNGLNVTNGNVILEEGQAGVAYTFVTTPDRIKEFTYFVVFNHEFPNGGVETKSGGDESDASGSHTIKAFGVSCKIEYQVKFDPDMKSIVSESTLVAEQPYEQSLGKVFLVDMTATPPRVTQLKLELPSVIPDLERPEAAEKFGKEILDSLRKADHRVDEFCQQVER